MPFSSSDSKHCQACKTGGCGFLPTQVIRTAVDSLGSVCQTHNQVTSQRFSGSKFMISLPCFSGLVTQYMRKRRQNVYYLGQHLGRAKTWKHEIFPFFLVRVSTTDLESTATIGPANISANVYWNLSSNALPFTLQHHHRSQFIYNRFSKLESIEFTRWRQLLLYLSVGTPPRHSTSLLINQR